jgi:hypothetical protein
MSIEVEQVVGEPTEKQKLTASRIRSFKRCRRADYYRYELGLRPALDTIALRYGTGFHRCVEILEHEDLDVAVAYAHQQLPNFADPYTPYTLAAQIRAYCWRWYAKCEVCEGRGELVEAVQAWDVPGAPIPRCDHCNGTGLSGVVKTLATEQLFHMPLRNPDGGTSRNWERWGKRDALIEYDGQTAIRETKTTAEDPNSERYQRRLLIDPQVSFYFLAARDEGLDIDIVLFDVCRKPSMGPAMATPVEKRKYTKEGKLYAQQREVDETPQEWEERLYADMLARPDFYLARHTIPRLEQDLEEHARESWAIAKDIRQAQLDGHWYRNPNRENCDGCSYFQLCTGMEQIQEGVCPTGLQYVSNIHPELPE